MIGKAITRIFAMDPAKMVQSRSGRLKNRWLQKKN